MSPSGASTGVHPASLRNYRLDEASLDTSVDAMAGRCHAQHGSKAAFTLVLPDGVTASMDFAQVDGHSDDFAAYLRGVLQMAVGDVVALQLPNSLHYPVAVFGAWKAGLVVSNVNPLCTERELREQLLDSRAKVLVTSNVCLATAAKVARDCGVRVIVAGFWEFFAPPVAQAMRAQSGAQLGSSAEAVLAAQVNFDTALAEGRRHGAVPCRRYPVALIQYTGGTTGRSKGAVLTHRNLAAVLQMTDDFLNAYDAPFRPNDVVLTVLPLYHVFAFVINFLAFFRNGAHNVLVPNPRPLANVRPAFEQFQITWMTGVDTLYAGLMAEPWFKEHPPKLRYALSGGTALRPTTGERWRAMVCPILEGYGMTETSCIVSFNPPNAGGAGSSNYRAGSVGLAMPGSDVRVVDAAGRVVAPGEPGELQVRGPNVTAGYLHRDDENATTFTDGWLRTGDVVTMDADGWITIVDRIKDMVLVSGFNVYPNEVEAVVAAHPDVLEVAVIGVPDESTGEAVCACIVTRNHQLTTGDVIAFCRSQLSAYKVPKQVRFVTHLPKSAVGKTLRARLREVQTAP